MLRHVANERLAGATQNAGMQPLGTTAMPRPVALLAPRPENTLPARAPGEDDLLDALDRARAAMMDAVVDGAGIEQIVELAAAAARGPVAAVVPRLGAAIARGDTRGFELASLERWLQAGASRAPGTAPPDVLSQTCIDLRGEVVGVLALLRAPSPPHQQAGEFLRLAAAAVLTQLAIHDATEALHQKLRGSFLEELREREDLGGGEIVGRALRLGCDLSGGAVILCAELTVERPRHVLAIIAGEHPGALAQVLDANRGPDRPRIYAILPAAPGSVAAGAGACGALARRLSARLAAYGVVATSSFHADPAALRQAIREAELALEVARDCGALITDEIGNGTYKLLFRMLASNPRAVQDFYEETLAPLLRCDALNHTELVATLQAYLDSNCNMNATATAVFAHRHTIAARLERIRDLTGLDPTVSGEREQLGLGLKAHRLLAPAGQRNALRGG